MAAKKGRARKRGVTAAQIKAARANKALLDRLEMWTPRQASDWAGMNYRALMRLIKARAVPCIVGEPARPGAGERRVYMVPKRAFQKWLECIEPPAANNNPTNVNAA